MTGGALAIFAVAALLFMAVFIDGIAVSDRSRAGG